MSAMIFPLPFSRQETPGKVGAGRHEMIAIHVSCSSLRILSPQLPLEASRTQFLNGLWHQ